MCLQKVLFKHGLKLEAISVKITIQLDSQNLCIKIENMG